MPRKSKVVRTRAAKNTANATRPAREYVRELAKVGSAKTARQYVQALGKLNSKQKPAPQHPFQLAGQLTDNEAATVLAALRVFQNILKWTSSDEGHVEYGPGDLQRMDHFEDGAVPLTAEQIDELCERINFEPVAKPRVVIGCDGGLVQWTISDMPVQIAVVDYDVEGADDDRILTLPPADKDDKPDKAYCYVDATEGAVKPERVAQLFKAIIGN